jgi:hypothetical protein
MTSYSGFSNSRPYFKTRFVSPKGLSRDLSSSSAVIDDVHGALLELHRAASRHNGQVDQLLRDLDIPVVVDPDLRDDVAGMSVADQGVSDSDFRHVISPSVGLIFGSTASSFRWRCEG